MSCTDSHVTLTIRMAFPLVGTSSNLMSLPAVAAKERVQGWNGSSKDRERRAKEMVKHSAANDETMVPMEMMMFLRVYPMGCNGMSGSQHRT